jgi:hypothetical protein
LIDLGASLDFHIDRGDFVDIMKNPTVYLMEIFRKFGLPFDHIYAFEMTPIAPEPVYAKLPKEFVHAYHWINLPVSSDLRSKLHPLQMILDQYNENDLVVVKLDIDTPHVEIALVEQLLQNDAYADLIDHFYFEHHVYLNEVAREWIIMQDSVTSSLQLFSVLRQKGIAAHYWP